MLQGNQMAQAMVNAGLIEALPQEKKRRLKQFKCRKCGKPMNRFENVNVMVCPNCSNSYFIFSK